MRLIDADELLRQIKAIHAAVDTSDVNVAYDTGFHTATSQMQGLIEYMPTISPDSLRPKGRWMKSEDDYCGLSTWKCSLCREEWCFEIDDDVKDLNYNFCPSCGLR